MQRNQVSLQGLREIAKKQNIAQIKMPARGDGKEILLETSAPYFKIFGLNFLDRVTINNNNQPATVVGVEKGKVGNTLWLLRDIDAGIVRISNVSSSYDLHKINLVAIQNENSELKPHALLTEVFSPYIKKEQALIITPANNFIKSAQKYPAFSQIYWGQLGFLKNIAQGLSKEIRNTPSIKIKPYSKKG